LNNNSYSSNKNKTEKRKVIINLHVIEATRTRPRNITRNRPRAQRLNHLGTTSQAIAHSHRDIQTRGEFPKPDPIQFPKILLSLNFFVLLLGGVSLSFFLCFMFFSKIRGFLWYEWERAQGLPDTDAATEMRKNKKQIKTTKQPKRVWTRSYGGDLLSIL
jgi:hypothetical protein